MANEGEVKTDVDRLIDLVKESKEISVEEVAKKLGIPAYTVEALSDLLEEEGMLHIKYKFTTPYLTSEMPSGPKSKAVKKREQELVIEKEQEKIKLKKAAESVKVEVKDLGKRVIKTGKEEGSDKKTLQAKEIKPETEMEEPKAEDVSWPTAGAGEDEEAKEDEAPPLRVIVQNQGSISGQNPSLKQPKSSQSVTEAPKLKMPKENKPVPKAEEKKPEDAPKISPEPLKKKEELGIPETDDLDELIKRANDFISKGDFEGARQVYLRIKKIKKDLPKKFVDQEKKAEVGLVDLNQNIISGIDRSLSTDFNKKISEIESLFAKADAHIDVNEIRTSADLEFVEGIYRQIKELYLSLPTGFMEKKVAIQDKMLALYRSILTSKKNILSLEFKSKSDNIIKLMDRLVSEINSKKIAEANKTFTEITHIYRTLPRGFLREKTDLQNKILSIYQRLILGKEEVFTKDIKSKSEQIKDLIHDAVLLVSKNNLRKAQAIYRKITDIYSTLPEGFYDVRADLEMKMIDLHHLIVLKHSRTSIDEMNALAVEIDSLMNSTMNYINENEIDLAKEAYKEIIQVYNSFPEGFIETNLKIRDKIVKLYKDILSKDTRPLIGEADSETEKIYTELLKLLVVIHDQIKKKQFHNVKEKYLLAYRLYHELPLSFLEKKTMLYTELYKIYEELKLYSEVMKLPEYANNKEYDKLKQSLSLIIDSHGKLLKRYPEDIELFRFVHGKCLLYMDLLKGLEPKTGLAVREKVENHVEQKKMPEIQKSKEIKEHEQNQNHIIEQTSMPGIHPSGSYSEEKEQPKILSAMEYLKKKYHPLG